MGLRCGSENALRFYCLGGSAMVMMKLTSVVCWGVDGLPRGRGVRAQNGVVFL